MGFEPACRATAIGSLPHIDPDEACAIVMSALSDIPMWPQLVKRSWKESMIVQYSEGMPGLIVDEDDQRIYFNGTIEKLTGEVEAFYLDYLSKCPERFKVSKEYAAGFYAFLDALGRHQESGSMAVKGHVVGPVTFALSVTNESKQAVFYDELLRDPVVKTLAMKADWQVAALKRLRPKAKAIIFFDEPYLQSFGSAFVNISREDVIFALNECFSAVDGLAGVHCCGNTDWSLLMATKADIISFDAYDYLENIALYPDQLATFINRGGILAWGIVPSIYPDPQQIFKEDKDSLLSRFESGLARFAGLGIDQAVLLRQSLVTPTCGTGSMSLEATERCLRLTGELSKALRSRYFES